MRSTNFGTTNTKSILLIRFYIPAPALAPAEEVWQEEKGRTR